MSEVPPETGAGGGGGVPPETGAGGGGGVPPGTGAGSELPSGTAAGPVVIAYDGSELSRLGIEEAGRLLTAGRQALVVCVWRPFDVGFVPVDQEPLDAERTPAVRAAAERTAAAGASLAEAAGFRAQSVAIEAAPTWKGIVEVAEQHNAGVIVLGSHGRSGLTSVLIGSVAGAVAAHSSRTVLIAHAHRD